MVSQVGSSIAVTPGSGAKIATGPTYTENSATVQDQKVILGEQYLPTYRMGSGTVSIGTSAAHLIEIMAGASLNVYVRSIKVYQVVAATTAALGLFQVFRLTSAGTGGTALNINPVDANDSAAGATAMTLPSSKGTNGALMDECGFYLIQTVAVSLNPQSTIIADFEYDGRRSKGLHIPAGTSNGIAVQVGAAYTGASVLVVAEITESPF